MSTTEFKDILEISQYIAIIAGIPIALVQYIITSRKERKDKEYETYNALDEKYIDYLKLCLDHPELDIYDISDMNLADSNTSQNKNEIIIFTILFSIFERAHFMYYDKRKKIKRDQWSGWEQYILDFSYRKNFSDAWRIAGEQFDEKFQKYMNNNIFNTKR